MISSNSPKHVLFLDSLSNIAGGQQVLITLLSDENLPFVSHALLPQQGELSYALTSRGVQCHYASMYNYTLVRKHWTDRFQFILEVPRLAIFLANLNRQLHIDLVYANASRNFIWGTMGALISRTPIVWHNHNLLGDKNSVRLINQVGKLPIVRKIICVSKSTQSQYPDLAQKSLVIHNPIDFTRFHPDEQARKEIRQELDIPDDAIVIGIVGDLFPLKSQHILIEALKLLPAWNKPIIVLIVGRERPDKESHQYTLSLKEMARGVTQQRIVFTGYRRDVEKLNNAMDILVSTSKSEALPLTIMEAMSQAKPVIASRVGGVPEIVIDGSTGYLYEYGDVAELCKYLAILVQNDLLRQSMGEYAYRFAIENFHAPKIRASIFKVMADAMRQHID